MGLWVGGLMSWRHLITIGNAKMLLAYMDIFGYIYGYGI
jgi:hypothetical protein